MAGEPTLQLGDSGEWVSRLQTQLAIWDRYDAIPIDGDFGDSTDAKLRQFQRANTQETGVSDEATWEALLAIGEEALSSGAMPTLKLGDSGEWVQHLQTQLAIWDRYDPVPIDGDFGSSTDAKLRQFQRANTQETGLCDQATWDALLSIAEQAVSEGTMPTLKLGDSGEWVQHLQTQLAIWDRGDAVPIDGDFGDSTDAKLRQFQKANTDETGVCDQATWDALLSITEAALSGGVLPTLKLGDRGEWVQHLQTNLAIWDRYDPVPIDGEFGDSTDAKLRQFQRANTQETGLCDQATWDALLAITQGAASQEGDQEPADEPTATEPQQPGPGLRAPVDHDEVDGRNAVVLGDCAAGGSGTSVEVVQGPDFILIGSEGHAFNAVRAANTDENGQRRDAPKGTLTFKYHTTSPNEFILSGGLDLALVRSGVAAALAHDRSTYPHRDAKRVRVRT